MNTQTLYRFKSNHWASSIALSSSAACWSRTDSAPPTVMTVPTPMYVVQIKSVSAQSAGAAGLTRRAPPPPAKGIASAQPAAADRPAAVSGEGTSDAPMDLSALAAGENAAPSAGSHARIELIIDSLPHQSLIQSIPVTVEPLGDKIYTATVSSLNITATGASVGETLLLLKDQIESIYHELNEKSRLDDEQRKMQHLLHTYIAKSHKYVSKETKKSSDWFRR